MVVIFPRLLSSMAHNSPIPPTTYSAQVCHASRMLVNNMTTRSTFTAQSSPMVHQLPDESFAGNFVKSRASRELAHRYRLRWSLYQAKYLSIFTKSMPCPAVPLASKRRTKPYPGRSLSSLIHAQAAKSSLPSSSSWILNLSRKTVSAILLHLTVASSLISDLRYATAYNGKQLCRATPPQTEPWLKKFGVTTRLIFNSKLARPRPLEGRRSGFPSSTLQLHCSSGGNQEA